MFLHESAVDSGKDLRTRDPVSHQFLQPVGCSPTEDGPKRNLVWNFSKNPVLLPLCPYWWKHFFLPASQTSTTTPHTHPTSVLFLCLLITSFCFWIHCLIKQGPLSFLECSWKFACLIKCSNHHIPFQESQYWAANSSNGRDTFSCQAMGYTFKSD